MSSQRTNIDNKLPKTASMKSQMKKASKQQIGTDLGKLPQTFILPHQEDRPPWTNFRRTKIHWLQFKTALKDWWSLVILLKWEVNRDPLTNKSLRKPMLLDERVDVAKTLHREFHQALGEGNMKKLQQICCDGILAKARTRIEQRRSAGWKIEPWKLMRYNGIMYPSWLYRWPLTALLPESPYRVVSDRIAPLPFADTSIRQCIVRIYSQQRYWMADMNGTADVDHRDYVVIQKMTSKGEEEEWKIWGLTEPCTAEEIDSMLSGSGKDAGTTLLDRVKEKVTSTVSNMQ